MGPLVAQVLGPLQHNPTLPAPSEANPHQRPRTPLQFSATTNRAAAILGTYMQALLGWLVHVQRRDAARLCMLSGKLGSGDRSQTGCLSVSGRQFQPVLDMETIGIRQNIINK